jgi:heat shock protein HslJ
MNLRFILTVATILAFAACSSQTTTPFTLADSKWTLTGIMQKGTTRTPVTGTNVTLDFTRDGKVNGSAGCNSYGGTFETQGEILKISTLAVTLMACVETEKMEFESAFLEGLQGAQLFERSADQLTITVANGNGKLVFRPR